MDSAPRPRLDGVLPEVTYAPAPSADMDGVPQSCGGTHRAQTVREPCHVRGV